MSVAVFRVKNFERFQHYKDRKPPWVKLYRDLWLDRDFYRLQSASKLLFIGLTTLASITDNRIPNDPDWIAHNLGLRAKDVDLNSLISAGFLCLEQDASNLLHENGSQWSVETETETETEERRQALVAGGDDRVSASELVESWNEFAARVGLATVVEINAERQRKIKARLTEHPKVEFWSKVLTNIELSDFLIGKTNGNGQHRNWRCNFDWLISNATVPVKIYEGGYNAQTQERGRGSGSGLQAAGMRR